MRGYYQNEEDSPEEDSTTTLENQLLHFHTSDQHERAISTGTELLAIDPLNGWVHAIMGQAYTSLEQYNHAEKHFKAAIAQDPDDADNFTQISFMELQRGRAGKADDYIRKSISMDPTSAYTWYIFGILCIHYEDFNQAQFCVAKIRELDPSSNNAEQLDVMSKTNIEGKNQYSTTEKISENEKLLGTDPENDFAHYQLANIYLHEIKDFDKAEFHFRKALEIDPIDKDYQKGLIKSWRKRDWILKTLWIPYLPIQWALDICGWANKKIWPYVFMIFIMKYILIAAIVVALIFYSIFWPVAKLYEYMTLAEIHRKMGVLKIYSGTMEQIHKWKLSKRMFTMAGIALFYWGCIALLTPLIIDHEAAKMSITAIIFGIFTIIVSLSWIWLIINAIKKSKRSSKNKSLKA